MASDKNETIITNALRVAAKQYELDAEQMATVAAEAVISQPDAEASLLRLKAQFEQQSTEALELADKIEQSGLDQVAYL